MPAANVPLVIDQGEDFTAQIIWTDDNGYAQKLTAPMRLDIVSGGNLPIASLSTPTTTVPNGTVPAISYSKDIGMIQIHVPKAQTAAMPAGVYNYDLFVTVNDGDVYAGNQQFRLLVGQCVVNQRITVM